MKLSWKSIIFISASGYNIFAIVHGTLSNSNQKRLAFSGAYIKNLHVKRLGSNKSNFLVFGRYGSISLHIALITLSLV
jgi:hypothetical protein